MLLLEPNRHKKTGFVPGLQMYRKLHQLWEKLLPAANFYTNFFKSLCGAFCGSKGV